jgi:hypothetical protein
VFSVTVFTALLGNGFQQWTFLCSQAHVLAGWPPSHTKIPSLLTAVSNSVVMAAGPKVSSARTAQKTPLPKVTPLFRVTQPLRSNGCFSGSTVLALSKYATILKIHVVYSLFKRTNSVQNYIECLDSMLCLFIRMHAHIHTYV